MSSFSHPETSFALDLADYLKHFRAGRRDLNDVINRCVNTLTQCSAIAEYLGDADAKYLHTDLATARKYLIDLLNKLKGNLTPLWVVIDAFCRGDASKSVVTFFCTPDTRERLDLAALVNLVQDFICVCDKIETLVCEKSLCKSIATAANIFFSDKDIDTTHAFINLLKNRKILTPISIRLDIWKDVPEVMSTLQLFLSKHFGVSFSEPHPPQQQPVPVKVWKVKPGYSLLSKNLADFASTFALENSVISAGR